MRNRFPGWYPLSPQEQGALSRSAVFALDSNVLLNLYGVGEETRAAFVDILLQLAQRQRLWLPHQAALEYQKLRPGKVLEQLKPSNDLRAKISEAVTRIEETAKQLQEHPFIDCDAVLRRIKEPLTEIETELQERGEEYADRLHHDELRDQLDKVFESAVGDPYSQEDLEEVWSEGRKRYKLKLPPGYADSKTHGGDKDEPECFGDLVLWRQLLDEAKRRGRAFVLVTEDWKKGDWYWKADPSKKDSRLLGPRPELVEEMYQQTGKRFHMCRTARFSTWMSQYLRSKLPDQAISELEEEPLPTFHEVVSAIGEAALRWQRMMTAIGSSPMAQAMEEITKLAQEHGKGFSETIDAWQDSIQRDISAPIRDAVFRLTESVRVLGGDEFQRQILRAVTIPIPSPSHAVECKEIDSGGSPEKPHSE